MSYCSNLFLLPVISPTPHCLTFLLSLPSPLTHAYLVTSILSPLNFHTYHHVHTELYIVLNFPLSVLLLFIILVLLSFKVSYMAVDIHVPFSCLLLLCVVSSLPAPLPFLPPSFLPLTRCPFCIYSTNRPAAMECHLKTHCKMEYRCRICQGLWPDQASLEAHMRRHRLGNHYKCEQCGYLSKTANKLIEHVRVHTGERPFHCDRCSYSCKRKDNLNLHKKLKHAPRQTFGCQECPFTTTHPFVFSRHLKKHQSGGTGGVDGALGGGGGGGEEEEEDEEAVGEELPMETSPGGSSLQKSQENFLFGGGGGSSSGGSGSNSPLMSLTASQALQSVALSLTLGKSQQLDPAGPRHGLVNANGVGGATPRDPSGASVAGDGGSPSLFLPSSRHMLEQYRNCDRAHLIPLTTLFTHDSRFTFHSQLHSRWRPATSPLLFSSNLASPSRSFPSPSSHKHSFLAYLGLMERAKTV